MEWSAGEGKNEEGSEWAGGRGRWRTKEIGNSIGRELVRWVDYLEEVSDVTVTEIETTKGGKETKKK